MCGRKDYSLRLFSVKKLTDGNRVKQIKLFVGTANYICETALLKIAFYRRAHQPAMAGHIYLCVL